MSNSFRSTSILCVLLAFAAPVAWAADDPDLAVVYRIKQEAFKRSQVMKHLFYMTDVYGPRLTNSPGYDAAADWVVETANEWGLENAHLESWGPFGRGWSTSRFAVHLIEPQYAPLIGLPLTWTPGTDGVVKGTPILTPIRSEDTDERREAELDRFIAEWQGKLDGKIIMLRAAPNIGPQSAVALKRFDSSELSDLAEAPEILEPIEIDFANPQVPREAHLRRRFNAQVPRYVREKLRKRSREISNRLNRFLTDEGVSVVIYPARRGDGGTIFPPRPGSHRVDSPLPPPSIALTPEHYNRIARLIEHGIPAQIEIEVQATIHDETTTTNNVVAEIPGGAKKDELVIIGAHFDDVVHGTGATDNAAGSAVMFEVMRILKTLDLPLDRTVRMVLWSGEEEGLLGSAAYVKEHFGDRETMQLKPEHAKVAGYFNMDNGTGKIRGVYLQENDMVRPVFNSWLRPFNDLGAKTLSIRNTGGTDHLSFDAVGLPGFQFIQDPVEYNTRTHHSNMDVYDRAQPGDLMQAAAIIASFVYHTANRDEMLPRKPLPEPWPEEARTEK